MTKSNRVLYLDILRVIACLSVIMIHSSASYVLKDIGSFNFWIANIFDGIARIGVPLFIMISGALMLDEDYHISAKKLIKRIVGMCVFFAFWSSIYCLTFSIIEPVFCRPESMNIMSVIGDWIKGYYHLWFIYLIIGLYLIVPLLRKWVNKDNKKYVEYFIVLSIVFTYILPQIITIGSYYSNFFEQLNDIVEKNLQLKYVGGYTTYFILGWYINNYDIKHKKTIYLFGLIGLLITIIGTYIVSITTGNALQLYDNLSINVLLQSVMVFFIIKNRYKGVLNGGNRIINSIAKKSKGIYAIHALIITIMYSFEEINANYALISIPIVFTVSFFLSYIISLILSKIRFLNKVV